MTQKELSYLEDAIGHEDNIIKICQQMLNSIKNDDLITFIKDEIDIHLTMKEKMINLLEVISNE